MSHVKDCERFSIRISDNQLDDLRERLNRARLPDQLTGVEWSYGTELGYLRELLAYWHDSFDWPAQEDELNRFDHYTTQLDGSRLHFLHQRSAQEGARPLLLLHGWPGSFFEFHKVIPALCDPQAHGGKKEDAFHVVCPSMPGFAWSEGPRDPGLHLRGIAGLYSRLMARLGYDRYLAQGGDLGSYVATHLGRDDPRCVAIHKNLVIVSPPAGVEDPTAGLTPEELRGLAQFRQFLDEENGYYHIQATKPQTLAYGLTDSPVGLAAWIVEKFHTSSRTEGGGEVECRISKDELLTNISIYWFTRSVASTLRLYREIHKAGELQPHQDRIEVPTACLIAPGDLSRPPRRWVEEVYNVARFTALEEGGHFIALENPQALVEDVRAFAAQVW